MSDKIELIAHNELLLTENKRLREERVEMFKRAEDAEGLAVHRQAVIDDLRNSTEQADNVSQLVMKHELNDTKRNQATNNTGNNPQ